MKMCQSSAGFFVVLIINFLKGKDKVVAHLNNTMKHVQFKKKQPDFADRFAAIQL
jgi:hypothetical protein